ncbi:MAG: MFS transporter [Chloroflexi bacterium]|nr:MFS transporter [Chloroflexota bacterium]
MDTLNPRGYTALLRNRKFVAMWIAQITSNTALNGAFFLQLILIEQVTGSSAHLAAVILAFSLPAVLLSALAGLIVDRVPKKWIMVASNGLRVVTGTALALLAAQLPGQKLNEAFFLAAIYVLVFVISAIGQFFAPAEGAMIPLLVRSENLLPANSLFTITFTASQILGLIILAPLGIKTIGIVGSLWVAVAMYLIATICVALIPRDHVTRAGKLDGVSELQHAWNEIREGWRFAMSHRAIFTALLQLSLISMLVMVMTMLAPGYAARVLGLSAEDSIYVFWPAGVGMLLASILVGRFGHFVSREVLASIGMFALALALTGLGWAGGGGADQVPLFHLHPELVPSTAGFVMLFALLTGIAMAAINIPAQTVVQERTHNDVRGRVMAVQFTISNALGIPPMLFIGNLADIYGIPHVTFAVAGLVVLLAALNLAWMMWATRHARLRHAAPIHPPSSTPKQP